MHSDEEEIEDGSSPLESQTGRIDDLLKEKLEKAFHKQTSKVRLHDIAKIACEHSPIDLAYAASHFPPMSAPSSMKIFPIGTTKSNFWSTPTAIPAWLCSASWTTSS